MMQIKDQMKYASTMKTTDTLVSKAKSDALVLACAMVIDAYQEQGFSAFSVEVENALGDLAVAAGWLPEELSAELLKRTIKTNAALKEHMKKFGN